MRRVWLGTSLVVVLLIVEGVYGSGTYRHPRPPSKRAHGFTKDQIERGKGFFEGTQLLGTGGQTCASCHGSGTQVPLKRSALNKKRKKLGELINTCLKDSARCAGLSLKLGDQQLVELGAYLISRYRLHRSAIRYLNSEAISKKSEE